MDPEIRNFSEIEKLIRSNPRQADALAGKWHEFVKLHPEVLHFESSEEFYGWTAENPNLHIDPDVWVGKEITDAYFYLRGQEEGGMPHQTTSPTPGIPMSGFGLPFLAAAYLAAPKLIEDDPDYQLIVERKKQEWLQNNPGKDLASTEGLDYIYGSLEKDEAVSPLHQEVEKEFRANPKYAKRVKRYDKERGKIYQNLKKDPALRKLSQTVSEHARVRFIHSQKENPDITFDTIQRQVEQRAYQAFVAKHQVKAEYYALVNPQIKSALEQRHALEQKQIQEGLQRYEETTVKEVRPTEEQATTVLERVVRQKQRVVPPQMQIISAPQVSSAPIQTAGPSLPVAGPLSRGINFMNRAGGLLSNPAQQLLGQGTRTIAGMATRAGITALLPAWLPFAVLIFILLSTFLIVGFTSAPGSPGSQTGATTALPGAIGNISSCQFTRGDQNPKSAPFKSSTLLGYFQEAERMSGVPAVILASIARVESPVSVAFTDDRLASFPCPKSSTGALGLMQIQPPGTKGHFADGVLLGASYLGKTPEQVNYCDLRENITVSAGFILKKLQLGFRIGDGKTWEPQWTNDQTVINKLAEGYYGCLRYPTCENKSGQGGGPYSYGGDLWESIQNCQQNQTVLVGGGGSIPAPNTQTLRGDIKNQFGVEFESGFSSRVLTWAWEALWTAQQRSPNFFSLLSTRYSVVNIKAGAAITNTSGNTITIKNTANGPLYSEQYFKQVFIHELGHVIYGPRSSPNPSLQNRINEAISKDGGTITAYPERSTSDPNVICGTPDTNTKASEDFSDSISYYVNINQEELTYGCGIKNQGKNPFQTGKYPNHLLFMQNLLLGTSF